MASTNLTTIKVSLCDRERNFCEDDAHRTSDNRKELILCTRENELDEEKPLDEEKLSALLKADPAKNETEIKMIELGNIKLTPGAVELIANCGAKALGCLRLYDCGGLNEETLKLFGQRFGKSISHLELLGASLTEAGLRAMIASIGNLEVLHLDSAISLLADYSGTITNLRHVWSKVSGAEDLPRLSQFVVKYAPYLRHLDITLHNTKEKTGEFVKLLSGLTGLSKLSITSTNNVNIEAELTELLAKLGPQLTTLNLCVWTGGDKTVEAISQCTALETLTLNGRSPMRHIDFSLEKSLAPLAKCTKLKNVRLILKNHSKQLLDKAAQHLAKVETLELEGLLIDDAALANLAGLASLAFLDIVSPSMTDAGLSGLISKLPALTFLRVNEQGSGKVGVSTLDAYAGMARQRLQTPMEAVFTEAAKIDLETRKSSFSPNLTVSVRNSAHFLCFPGNTPRGF
ncbi:hypothetical protein TYRP_014348 [Tyrophagus putrescentiae]|nr:hypothetical protein TYRP_014348 [Tyrophagus putrescentiae]